LCEWVRDVRRKTAEHQLRSLKTGRSYRPESAWIWSEAPAIITVELFDKAQWQLRRNVATARKMYQPTSGQYLLRTLVTCGECGLGMVGIQHLSPCKKYDYLYYECAGHAPLTVGRPTKCPAKLVRAERLDAVVWQALEQLLRNPSMIPQLHQTWAVAKQQTVSGLEAQQAQLRQRRQRIERQDQRLLDAYQAEIITLRELQTRRQKLAATLQQIEQESRQLAHTRQQSVQWQQVIDNATTFRQLLGTNLARLSFEERQAIAQCLISKVVVTGEEVDVHFLLPFNSTPQVAQRLSKAPEGVPGHFYRLRLAHFHAPAHPHRTLPPVKRLFQQRAILDSPPVDGGVIDVNPTFFHEFLDVACAQRVRDIPVHPHENDLWGEMGPLKTD
jgi:site-specific DNA recombinase